MGCADNQMGRRLIRYRPLAPDAGLNEVADNPTARGLID